MGITSRNNLMLIIGIILLLLLSGFLLIKEKNRKKELNEERLTNQSLLEKNQKLKNELKVLIDDFNKNNENVNGIIKEKERLIAENERKIQQLISENRSGNNAKKQIIEIQNQNNKLQSEIIEIKEKLHALTRESQNQSDFISNLEEENRLLKKQNDLFSKMITNNVRISALKGKKNKLTVIAAKANIISATLDIPASISNNVNFVIIYPNGTKITSKEESASIKISDQSSENQFEMSTTGLAEAVKSVEFNYAPKTKLRRGIYKLLVYNENDYITGVHIGLK